MTQAPSFRRPVSKKLSLDLERESSDNDIDFAALRSIMMDRKVDVKVTNCGQIYVSDSFWDNIKTTESVRPPYDIDGNCKYSLPLLKEHIFCNSKDERH